MRAYVGIALVAVAGFWTWGCGGSGYGSSPSTPTAPTSTPSALTLTPGATDLVTVNVVAINGAQSSRRIQRPCRRDNGSSGTTSIP
jgi:hypothetical protein